MNTDKFVPNPRHTSPLTLRMFEFVGKIVGIALRHRNYIPFEFAPIVRGVDGTAPAESAQLTLLPSVPLVADLEAAHWGQADAG